MPMVIISLTMSRTCISFVLCKRAHKKTNFVFSLSFSHKKSQNYKTCPLIIVVCAFSSHSDSKPTDIFDNQIGYTHLGWASSIAVLTVQSTERVLCFDISIYVKSVFIIMERIFIQIQFNK